MSKRTARAAIALALTCTSAAAAQGPTVFRTSTDVVLVPVSVTDRDGRFARGLTADQFEISVDGNRRAVTHFSAERVPVSLVLLLDISGSMAQNPQARAADDARWADTRRALELLVTRLSGSDEVLFAVFNEQVLASAWTQEYGSILGTFDMLRPGGDTALLGAVKQIASVFRTAKHHRKVLLLISDGNDSHVPAAGLPAPAPYAMGSTDQLLAQSGDWRRSRRELFIEGTRTAVRASDAAVYGVGIGTRQGVPVDTNMLDALTKESGGYAELLRNPSDITAAVARIWDDVQSQYFLTFDAAQADGKFHPIRVRTKNGRLRVRTRAGYVAAPAP